MKKSQENQSTLNQSLVKGTFWTVLMRTSIRMIGVVSTLILARLLTPEDFGLVAKAMLVYGILELTSQFGFSNALIKNQHATDADYNTVWTLSAIRSAVIGGLLIFSAYPLAIFFNDERLVEIIAVFGVVSLLCIPINVGIVNFRRDMRFDLDFKFNFLNKVASFTITLIIAFIYRSYWALVFGIMASTLSSLILSYIMSPYRPRFGLSRWREVMGFSKWVLGYEMLSALSMKIDLIILSKFSSNSSMGLYTVANEVAAIPSTEISMPVARASLPALSKLNHDLPQFKEMYVKTLSLVLFLAIPSSIGLSLVAESAVSVMLGDSWIQASIFVEILAIYGLVRVINAISTSAYMAYDIPNILANITFITLILRLILLPIGMYLGAEIGLCWALVIAALFGAFINLYRQQRIGFLSVVDLFRLLYRVILSAVGMWIVLKSVTTPANLGNIQTLIFEITIGVITYSLILGVLLLILPSRKGPELQAYNYLKEKTLPFFRARKNG